MPHGADCIHLSPIVCRCWVWCPCTLLIAGWCYSPRRAFVCDTDQADKRALHAGQQKCLPGLSTSLKTSAIKNLARRSSQPTIRRPRSLLLLLPQVHFITHNSLPTDLVSTKQLKDGRKQEESILSYERIGMAELAAMSLKVSICCQCLPAVTG